MFEATQLRLHSAEKTQSAGKSLAQSLYPFPLTILLKGELGAGKTTFLQGFAARLGVQDTLTSPTFALEQTYKTSSGVNLLHLDLYRLSSAEAERLVAG